MKSMINKSKLLLVLFTGFFLVHTLIADCSAQITPDGSVDTHGDALSVYVSGAYAYVAVGDKGLQVIDIAAPADPKIVATVNTPGYAWHVHVSGNYAYVADGSKGLLVIDISTPDSPTIAGAGDTLGYASDVYVSGSYAYVAAGDRGLQVIDITTPNSPTRVAGILDDVGHSTTDVYVEGAIAYAITFGSSTRSSRYAKVTGPNTPHEYHSVWLIDISDPLNPTKSNSFSSSKNSVSPIDDVYVTDNYFYITSYYYDEATGLNYGLFEVIKVSDLTTTGTALTPGYARGIYVAGKYAYVADGDEGLQVLDIGNPERPTIVGNADIPGDAHGVYVAGNYSYVTADSYLYVIETGFESSGASSPVTRVVQALAAGDVTITETIDLSDFAGEIYVDGDFAYAADGEKGIHVIDVRDPSNFVQVGYVDTPGHAYDIYADGDYAFVADGLHGLLVLNVSDPYNPGIINTLDLGGNAKRIRASGGRVYVTNDGYIQILDISEPGKPVLPGSAGDWEIIH